MSAGEVSEKSTEPQPPPGLSRLSAAQQSLAEFLEVDEDLLAAAGLIDPPGSKPDGESDAELDASPAALPEAEKNAILKLLLTGHVQQAERTLKLQSLAWRRDQPSGAQFSGAMPATPRRKVADLHKLAASAADFNKCWRTINKHAERGIASAYDEVKRSLVDLSDAYALCATRADFDRRLAKFMARHGKRGALVRRLVEAGLWQKSSQ